jgi:cytochrome P450
MKAFDLRTPAFIDNPYPTYRAMRDQAPVWREPFTGHVFVTRYDDVLSVLKDSRFSSNRIADRMKRVPPEVNTENLQRMLADRLVMTDGDRHRDLRREVGSAFTAAMVRTYARETESTIQQAFERFSESEMLDVLNDLALPIPSQVIMSVIGLPPRGHTQLRQWAEDFYLWLADSPGGIVSRTEKAIASVDSMSAYISEELPHVSSGDEGAYLARMKTNLAEHRMTETEVVANLIGVINAAHETTTSLIMNGTLALLGNPEQLQILIEEPDLIPDAVDEMLRFDSPSQVISRIATEDLELGGVEIAEGDMLALVLGSANRDERVFTNPDSFNIRRQDRQQLAFGHGSHFCTGRGLASLEVAMIFRRLVPLLPNAKIVSGPIQWRPSPAFRSPMALSIEFDTVAITIAEFGGNWWSRVPTKR